MNRCKGCGATLQSVDKNALGYTSKNDAKYCERCFKTTNYNETKLVNIPVSNNNIIDKINKEANYVLFITDFLNISDEVISAYKEIKTKKVFIINKIDVLPKSFSLNKIKDYLEKEYEIDNIIFTSTLKSIGLLQLKNIIEQNNNVYLVGYTNSGKSSIINALSSLYNKKDRITTSIIPNTTIDFLKINLGNNTIFDTPGMLYVSSIYNFNDINLIKQTNIKKPIKPITLQIKENDHVLIGGILELINTQKNSFTFYMNNNIEIKKVYKNILNLEAKEYVIKDNTDLIIKGLGFINIKKGTNIKIITNYHELIEIRSSIIGSD